MNDPFRDKNFLTNLHLCDRKTSAVYPDLEGLGSFGRIRYGTIDPVPGHKLGRGKPRDRYRFTCRYESKLVTYIRYRYLFKKVQ